MQLIQKRKHKKQTKAIIQQLQDKNIPFTELDDDVYPDIAINNTEYKIGSYFGDLTPIKAHRFLKGAESLSEQGGGYILAKDKTEKPVSYLKRSGFKIEFEDVTVISGRYNTILVRKKENATLQ
jgi:hypothetical protein